MIPPQLPTCSCHSSTNDTDYYLPPDKNDTTGESCGCNTVIYSLTTACTLCQINISDSWYTYVSQKLPLSGHAELTLDDVRAKQLGILGAGL